MNDFLQNNLAELVGMVTRLIESGVSLGKEQLPELLKQMVAYRYIDYQVGLFISTLLIIIATTLLIIAIKRGKEDEDDGFFLTFIILSPIVIIICLIVAGLTFTGILKCNHTPMVVILQTLRGMKI